MPSLIDTDDPGDNVLKVPKVWVHLFSGFGQDFFFRQPQMYFI